MEAECLILMHIEIRSKKLKDVTAWCCVLRDRYEVLSIEIVDFIFWAIKDGTVVIDVYNGD